MGAMRRAIVLGAWLVLAIEGRAHADKRIQDLIPGFQTEANGCEVQGNGLAKVATGAEALAKAATGAEREELERDLARLAAGVTVFRDYCGQVGALVAFLQQHAQDSYRSVEREIDTRDNALRKARRDARKLVEELQPITRKLIGRMAVRPTAADEPGTPGKFPSGRAIELPRIGGSWRLSGTSTSDTADYTDKTVTASVTSRAAAGGCDDQRKALAARTDDKLTELEPAKDPPIAWSVRYTRRDKTTARLAGAMCAPTKTGHVLATADVAPADRTAIADQLAKLMVRMIAVQLAPPPAPAPAPAPVPSPAPPAKP